MEQMVIKGGYPLNGEVDLQGSKNSALPILAATVLCEGKTVIHKCPDLTDVKAAIKILEYLGCIVDFQDGTVIVDSTDLKRFDIPEHLMREMRSSIVFLGSLLGRMGKAYISSPGGCEIGLRPIDLHIKAMEQLGVEISDAYGNLDCKCSQGIIGTEITLSFPSVGATENIMLVATMAKGKTVIVNAAREPEIEDLALFLNACGADISGAGNGTIEINGVKKLSGTEHTVIPDRIVATTYMAAAALTGGEIVINHINPSHITPAMPAFLAAGCNVDVQGNRLKIAAPERLNALGTIRTMPYPGFPTDFQAPAMTMASIAGGTSVFIETIFESRYKHVSELIRLGANIKVEGRVAVVEGVKHLSGASVTSPDLRGGTCLVLAGLCARGSTTIRNLSHIDRGCEKFEQHLMAMGAKIKREDCNGRQEV